MTSQGQVLVWVVDPDDKEANTADYGPDDGLTRFFKDASLRKITLDPSCKQDALSMYVPNIHGVMRIQDMVSAIGLGSCVGRRTLLRYLFDANVPIDFRISDWRRVESSMNDFPLDRIAQAAIGTLVIFKALEKLIV